MTYKRTYMKDSHRFGYFDGQKSLNSRDSIPSCQPKVKIQLDVVYASPKQDKPFSSILHPCCVYLTFNSFVFCLHDDG